MDNDEEFRKRGRALRSRQLDGEALSESESQELAEYMHRIEAEEAERLRPSREREEAHLAQLHQRNAELQRLIGEREVLAHRLQNILVEAEKEQARIDEEFSRLVLHSPESLV